METSHTSTKPYPRQDLQHPFEYEWVYGNNCCHWFDWLGGKVRCKLPENDPIHVEERNEQDA